MDLETVTVINDLNKACFSSKQNAGKKISDIQERHSIKNIGKNGTLSSQRYLLIVVLRVYRRKCTDCPRGIGLTVTVDDG